MNDAKIIIFCASVQAGAHFLWPGRLSQELSAAPDLLAPGRIPKINPPAFCIRSSGIALITKPPLLHPTRE